MLQRCLPLSESLQKRSLYWDFQALLSYSLVLISPPIIRLSSLSRSFSHSLTGSVPQAVLKNLAGRIFSESFIHMLYHIWYNMSSSMLYMNVTIELYGSVARMAITPSAKPRPKTIASAPTSQTGSPMLAESQSVNNARGRPCRSLAETCSIPCGSTVSTCSRYSPPTFTGFSIELTSLIDISFVARIDIGVHSCTPGTWGEATSVPLVRGGTIIGTSAYPSLIPVLSCPTSPKLGKRRLPP